MKIFVLEDEIGRYPRIQIVEALKGHDLTIATSCDEAKAKYTQSGPFGLLLLDHDLEGNYELRPDYPNTGLQFVKFLATFEQAGPKPQVYIHSWNNVGARNMQNHLLDHNWPIVERVPFGMDYVKALKALKTGDTTLDVKSTNEARNWEAEFYTKRTK